MEIEIDGLMFCDDCMIAACNDDYSGMNDERAREVSASLSEMGHHLVPSFDSDSGDGVEEFSWSPCDCCGSKLGGGRHSFAILK